MMTIITSCLICISATLVLTVPLHARTVHFEPVSRYVHQFDVFEVNIKVAEPVVANPFIDATVRATFESPNKAIYQVDGFCDSQDGTLFKVRYCPSELGTHRYYIVYRDPMGEVKFDGNLRCIPGKLNGPIVVDSQHPHHFVCAGTGEHFYHLGYTAYHLLDISNAEWQIRDAISTWLNQGFNKVRFLLAGYPRDNDTRTEATAGDGGREQWRMPNYGAPPGEVNPLPVWLGRPHNYDFTRFNIPYWRKVDNTVRFMRDKGMVATCIFTIEKQNLPKEYGALSEHEMRFYRYAIARLAAFCNVWWDLGNEHNEYRDVKWGNSMGQLVKEWDPYDRLTSAHAYADWLYGDARWADFIITQQYGTPKDVNAWVLKYRHLNMPYINEEYGYEGREDKHGHAQNADWVRRCHWSIAMAGGYATYGIWFEGAFYTGHVGSGKAPAYLKLLRSFFERYPYWLMTPANELVNDGNFCLTLPRQIYIIYAPYGGAVSIDLSSMKGAFVGRWFNPRTGSWIEIGHANGGTKWNIHAPDQDDWVLELTSKLR